MRDSVSSTAVISAIGLTKVFRDFWHRARVKAVNNIDLEIHPGEIYGLLGPNGSGKSTTIKMILGLLRPTRGRVAVFGQPPDDVRIKSRIGYLPEESYLYRFLNARETLDYYGTLFELPRRERKRRIEELLEMVGLRSAARRPVGEYSKGMARRIGLAQALINDPDLLILDEPTSGLDPIGSKLVKDIIVRLRESFRKTIVLSSHLLADVEEVCGRVAILYGGKVQVSGTLDEVLTRSDQVQLTLPPISDETISAVRELILKREGVDITVDMPRDRLESLFLRIVQQAHKARVETSGTTAAGEIAGFLGQQPEGRAIIESLLQPVEPGPEPASQPEPVESRADADVLGGLTRSKADETPEQTETGDTGEGAKAAMPERRRDVDRAVLEDLAGDQSDKKSS